MLALWSAPCGALLQQPPQLTKSMTHSTTQAFVQQFQSTLAATALAGVLASGLVEPAFAKVRT